MKSKMSCPIWSDLHSPSLVPPMGGGKADPDAPASALMISTRPDFKKMHNRLGRPRSRPFYLGERFISSETSKNRAGVAVVGPYMGAPYAVMLLESLVKQGTRHVTVLGWCGAVDPGLNIGDVLQVEEAISQEGTSAGYRETVEYYPIIPKPQRHLVNSRPDHEDLLDKALAGHRIKKRSARIWTTDAIYRETVEKRDYFRSRGAVAVEMECSALFAVAAYRDIGITVLLIVSDDLSGHHWQPAMSSKRFSRARHQVIDALAGYVSALSDQEFTHG